MRTMACAILVLVSLCIPVVGATYTGSLTYNPAVVDSSDELFVGPTNLQWINYQVSISWVVTDQDTSYPGFPWKYTYRFSHNGTQAGYSHTIIEASPGMTLADVTGIENAQNVSVTTQAVASGNPDMPEDMYGIRFHPLEGGLFDWTWSFFSNRQPVWGDFYGRCGGKLGGINHAYNYNLTNSVETGFLDPDSNNAIIDDPDPANPAADGNSNNHFFYHILRPDSQGGGTQPEPDPTVPEPCMMTLCGLAVVGVGGYLRRRRRVA